MNRNEPSSESVSDGSISRDSVFSQGSAVRVVFGLLDSERDSKLETESPLGFKLRIADLGNPLIRDHDQPLPGCGHLTHSARCVEARKHSMDSDPTLISLEAWSFGDGEDDDLFAGHGADVVVHADDLDAHGFVDQ